MQSMTKVTCAGPVEWHAANTNSFYWDFQLLGIDFMSPFSSSSGYLYILIVVDYMSKWVEAVACKTSD